MVTLSDFPTATSCWRDWPEDSAHAEVEIDRTDAPARLDLRYLVGLTVLVYGYSAVRVHALGDAAERAGAARVLRIVLRVERMQPTTESVTDSMYPELEAA